MLLQSLTSQEYTDFRQISLRDVIKLSKITQNNNSKKVSDFVNSSDTIFQLNTLKKNSTQIYQSIKNYSESLNTPPPHLTTLQKIKRFIVKKFTFNFFTNYKIKSLNKSLKIIIKTISEIEFLNLTDRFKTENCEVDPNVNSQNSQVNLPIHRKLNQIVAVHRKFTEANPDKAQWDRTAHEVNQYILEKFILLNLGEDIAIQPELYHSSLKGFDGIITEKIIHMSNDGMRSKGTYLSTNIEFEHYGAYAFAIDSTALNSAEAATCFSPLNENIHGKMGKYKSVWVCYRDDIQVSPQTVPMITVDTIADRDNIAGKVKKFNLDIPILTRKACYRISDLFEKIRSDLDHSIPTFPSSWTVEVYVKGSRPLTENRVV